MKTPSATKAKAVCHFLKSASLLGGAEWIQYPGPLASRLHHRVAFIKIPSQEKPVKVPLNALPPMETWNAFNIADVATLTIFKSKI